MIRTKSAKVRTRDRCEPHRRGTSPWTTKVVPSGLGVKYKEGGGGAEDAGRQVKEGVSAERPELIVKRRGGDWSRNS